MKLKTINQYLIIAIIAMTITGCGEKDKSEKDKSETVVEKTSAIEPTNQTEKLGYSLGYIIGQRLKNDFNDLNVDFVLKGMKDALMSLVSTLSLEKMNEIVSEDQKIRSEKMREKMEKEAVENSKRSEDFLKENKKKEDIKVTDSGLQYREIKNLSEIDKKELLDYLKEKPVRSNEMPTESSQVTVSYVGSYIDADGKLKQFDASNKRNEAAKFSLSDVIPGWKEGIKLMQPGQVFELFIPPELGYAKHGVPGIIPGNAVLIFKVALIEIKESDTMTADNKDDDEEDASEDEAIEE